MIRILKHWLIFITVFLIVFVVFWGISVSKQNGKVKYNSKTMLSNKETPIATSNKILNLMGSSSIIITIYPSIMDEKAYLIELFGNGVVVTSVGIVSEEAFIGEFNGTKDGIFKELIDTKKRILLENEIEEINQIICKLNLEKDYKQYRKKFVGVDADQKMIWIENKAYYFLGALPSKNKITKLIEKVVVCSPIKVDVK